jgi:hypothetical protein
MDLFYSENCARAAGYDSVSMLYGTPEEVQQRPDSTCPGADTPITPASDGRRAHGHLFMLPETMARCVCNERPRFTKIVRPEAGGPSSKA